MSKRNRQKRKLRQLIQKRLREVESQPIYQTQSNTLPMKIAESEEKSPQKAEQNEAPIAKKNRIEKIGEDSKQETLELRPDFKKIGIITALLTIIIGLIFLISVKTQIINNLASKLFTIFQNS